jgi:hypothetical protein
MVTPGKGCREVASGSVANASDEDAAALGLPTVSAGWGGGGSLLPSSRTTDDDVLTVVGGNVLVTCVEQSATVSIEHELFDAEPAPLPAGDWDVTAQAVVTCVEPLVVTSWEGDRQEPPLTPAAGSWHVGLYARGELRATHPAGVSGDVEEHVLHLWPVS